MNYNITMYVIYLKMQKRFVYRSPLPARSTAVSLPIPVLAPVIITVFPSRRAVLWHRPPPIHRRKTTTATPAIPCKIQIPYIMTLVHGMSLLMKFYDNVKFEN